MGVALRCYVRFFMQKIMGWDDWLMVLSLGIYTMYTSFVLASLHYGAGRHELDLDESNFLWALRYWYFCECAYVLNMATIKVSIALFYLRIIVSPWQRLAVKSIMWIAISFGFGIFWCAAVQCWPISFIWEQYATTSPVYLTERTGSCVPKEIAVGASYVYSIISAGIDWALALLPIVMLWDVRIPTGVKVIVGGVVACGVLASTATLIRISTIAILGDMQDFLFRSVFLAIWSYIEPGIAIFASCLATLRPLLRRLFPNHFQNVAVHEQPELQIPVNLAGKKPDIDLGNNFKTKSEESSGSTLGESSKTIETYLESRSRNKDEGEIDTPTSFYDGASDSSSRSEGENDNVENSSHPLFGPSTRLSTLVFTPTTLSPTIITPSTLSPSHVAFSMRESQYIRNSKEVIPLSPV
ncbi:hypothetical protein SBOR_5535 [Sclerotinia borealis F-4128]|uniref:Rhodopsin domain-containing protein n=1 Tax=Sclerotinia borealis (strain F-4128) TaxID=1432307 RepID=W9CH34_SCLBF|nr:hypothetical protein SBOR_5535 [Sclerotinia borealis F-4128]